MNVTSIALGRIKYDKQQYKWRSNIQEAKQHKQSSNINVKKKKQCTKWKDEDNAKKLAT